MSKLTSWAIGRGKTDVLLSLPKGEPWTSVEKGLKPGEAHHLWYHGYLTRTERGRQTRWTTTARFERWRKTVIAKNEGVKK